MSFSSSLQTGLSVLKFGAGAAVSTAKNIGNKIANPPDVAPAPFAQPRRKAPSSFRSEFGLTPSGAFTPEEDYDFDVIVVGAGIAGSVCALELAKKGHEVLLAERGAEVGEKNLSGGVFYSRVMDEVIDGFADKAPVERVITRNRLMILNEDSAVTLEAYDQKLTEPVNAVSVLRSKLDPWLAEQCEEAGVTLMTGVRVDELVRSDINPEQIIGIRAGKDTLTARIVIAADGANSFLARKAGLSRPPALKEQALGVKSVIELDEKTICERFGIPQGTNEGVAYAVVGKASANLAGGGFIYTNSNSVSIGVVVRLDEMEDSTLSASDIHDAFLNHPSIAPLIEGGKLLEYGAHLVNEGGIYMMDGLVAPGFLSIGDAAGFTVNTGLTIRGMDFAAGSAIAAAKAAHHALEAENYSQATLNTYLDELDSSWVGKDMVTYADTPHFFDNKALYSDIGTLASDIFYRAYAHDGTPRTRLSALALRAVKESSLNISNLVRLGYSALREL
ncbi:MAG: FAD-dependent oxidoreductase [Actinomycetaceae bacterium]|nr:FAD-dependent oxidoreductase [Actinomycetaceae bacterium]